MGGLDPKFEYGEVVYHIHTRMNYLIVGIYEPGDYGYVYQIEDTVGRIYDVREHALERNR